MTDKPHDRFFKAIFEQRAHAVDHVRAFLPPSVVREIDLHTFAGGPTEHIEARLEARDGDLRYTAEGHSRQWVFRLMLEAQSQPDSNMPLRCAWYTLYDIEQYQASGAGLPSGLCPLVYPMIVYNGRRPWSGPLRLSEMYGQAPPELLGSAHVSPLDIRPHLIDLWRIDDDELRTGALGGLPLLALKYGREPELLGAISSWSSELNVVWARPDRDAIFTSLLEYFIRVNQSYALDDFRDIFNNTITREAGGYMETWFTRKIAEGRHEGECKILLAQLRLKFPQEPVAALSERLRGADEATLERYGERILTASTLDEVFSD